MFNHNQDIFDYHIIKFNEPTKFKFHKCINPMMGNDCQWNICVLNDAQTWSCTTHQKTNCWTCNWTSQSLILWLKTNNKLLNPKQRTSSWTCCTRPSQYSKWSITHIHPSFHTNRKEQFFHKNILALCTTSRSLGVNLTRISHAYIYAITSASSYMPMAPSSINSTCKGMSTWNCFQIDIIMPTKPHW
jgi:hypothetical protein